MLALRRRHARCETSHVTRLFDVRAGEARGKLIGFAALLLLIIGAHTILETARDALLLTGPGPKALGFVYMAIAAGTVPGAALTARVSERFGQRRALAATLAVAVAGPVMLFFVPTSHAAAMATYVLSGILGSIVVPQFWTLVGMALTVGQARRLFGLITAAGVLGGVLGPLTASGALLFLPAKGLLLVSAIIFAGAMAALALVQTSERVPEPGTPRRVPLTGSLRAFREYPFLKRVALVMTLSTATFLALDYLFKSTITRAMPSAELPRFIAHYYLALNGVSLIVQLLSSTVVRRLGVLPALVPTPLLLLGSSVLAFLGGGALPGVLLVKGIDGSLRYSLHHVTEELMYLPVPATARQRTKPLIDGGLARIAQAATGAGLLALGGTGWTHPRPMAAIVAVLAAAWLATVVTMRRPYLSLLRRAVTSGSFDTSDNVEPIDLETAQLLVQSLASEDPYEVGGAMAALSRRGRAGFVPALVLLHRDEGVLVQALEMFGESSRSDWFALAHRLLDDPRESVRVAAARALARHEQLDAASLANDVGWRARGYAAVRMALRDGATEVALNANVASLLDQAGEEGAAARLGLLAAVADAPPTPRLSPLLRILASEPRGSREKTELLARAAACQKDPFLVPHLVSLLSAREGREAVRAALVALGEPALEEVLRTMRDPRRERRLRLHMPKTLARFATRRATECLLQEIETEKDGLIRYKAIRALRGLVVEHRIPVHRRRTERLCCADLEDHFHHLALRRVLDVAAAVHRGHDRAPPGAPGREGCTGIRAGVRPPADRSSPPGRSSRVHRVAVGGPLRARERRRADRRAPATGDQQRLRALFRLATDDLSLEERVERARAVVLHLPRTRDEGLDALVGGDDAILVTLAQRDASSAAATSAGRRDPDNQGEVTVDRRAQPGASHASSSWPRSAETRGRSSLG